MSMQEQLTEFKEDLRALVDHWYQSAANHEAEAADIICMTAEDFEAKDSLEAKAEGIRQCALDLKNTVLEKDVES